MQFDLYLYITVRGNGTTVNVSLRAMSWSLSTFKHIHHSTNDFYHITFRTDLIIDVSGLMACPGKKFFFFSEAPQRQPKNQWRRLKWWSRKQLPRDPPLMYRFQVPGDDAARYATCIHTIWGYYEKVERWESISSTEIGDWVWFEIFATIDLTWIGFSIWTYLDNIWKIQMTRKQMMIILF